MPFLTPPSQYRILGSNITGGEPNLIVNNGINNLALGNFVLTNNTSGNGNVAIGNSALNANTTGENNIAFGVEAGLNFTSGDDNVLIGDRVAKNTTSQDNSVIIGSNAYSHITLSGNGNALVAIGADAALSANLGVRNTIVGRFAVANILNGNPAPTQPNISQRNVVIGENALFSQSSTSVDVTFNNNVIIGERNLETIVSNAIDGNAENNIIVGNFNRIFPAAATYDVQNKIIIANGQIPNNNGDFEIIIGDPDATYTNVIVGGVDLLAGGGGFAAEATQNSNTLVSITSAADDGVSGIFAGYELKAETDNLSLAQSSAYEYASFANNSVQLERIGAADSGSATFSNNLTSTDGTTNVSNSRYVDLQSGALEINAANGANLAVANFGADVASQNAFFFMSVDDGVNNIGGGFSLNLGLDVVRYEVTGATVTHEWTVPAEIGADTATFAATNAPAAISPTNWIAITLNGVAGYIPFFSA